jgi:hypothetical protein
MVCEERLEKIVLTASGVISSPALELAAHVRVRSQAGQRVAESLTVSGRSGSGFEPDGGEN